MKTKNASLLLLTFLLLLFSGFSSERNAFEFCTPATSNFTVILTDLGGTPISSVSGNTVYFLKASFANGNGWYGLEGISGFVVQSSNPEDNSSPWTSFRIKTNAGVSGIRAVMVSGSGCDSSQGAQMVQY